MSPKLEKFVDPLPIMETLKPVKKSKKESFYVVKMEEFTQQLHRDLPPTRLWGYEGQYPGPTIDVNQGEKIKVEWKNNLPDKHFLPLDTSIHQLDQMPEVRTVTHLHGSETKADSDGYPEAWYTKDYQEVGSFFTRKVYEYPNHQRGATLWYHDHAMGITRLNVYAGLAGMYIIRDQEEKALPLPSGPYEVPLILQDRSFQEDGSLFYPTQPDDPEEGLPNPSITPFFLGETNLVNGKVWPYFEVEPRKYRFRILNGANTRTYQLHLSSEQSFYQIGSDGGLLAKTVPSKALTIEPGVRVDVIIDFSNYVGETILLKNDLGPDPNPDDETDDVMQFRVTKPLAGKDTSRVPRFLSRISPLKNNPITAIRNLKLVATTDNLGRPLNLLDNKFWHDPITEKPLLGTTEIWSFINTTGFSHPIHIHLIQFQVLDRQPFDLERYNQDGQILYTGPAKPPLKNERGWKDIVPCPAGEITRVIVKFAPYSGLYVWHCHILEHEDYDMMRPLLVVEKQY